MNSKSKKWKVKVKSKSAGHIKGGRWLLKKYCKKQKWKGGWKGNDKVALRDSRRRRKIAKRLSCWEISQSLFILSIEIECWKKVFSKSRKVPFLDAVNWRAVNYLNATILVPAAWAWMILDWGVQKPGVDFVTPRSALGFSFNTVSLLSALTLMFLCSQDLCQCCTFSPVMPWSTVYWRNIFVKCMVGYKELL